MQKILFKHPVVSQADATEIASQLIDISRLDISNGQLLKNLYKEMKKICCATDRPATDFYAIYKSCRNGVEQIWGKTIDNKLEYEIVPVDQMPKTLISYSEDVYKKTKKHVVDTDLYAPTCLPMYRRIIFPDKLAIAEDDINFYSWDERFLKKTIMEELDHWMNYQVRGELGQDWWSSISPDFKFDRKVRYKYEALAQRNIEKYCLQERGLVIPTLYTNVSKFSIYSFDPNFKELESAYIGVLALDSYGPELIAKIDYTLPTDGGLELVFNEKHPTYKQRVADVVKKLQLDFEP